MPDETNPDKYLTEAEAARVETEYAEAYAKYGEDDPMWDKTAGEPVWKWAYIHYRKGKRS